MEVQISVPFISQRWYTEGNDIRSVTKMYDELTAVDIQKMKDLGYKVLYNECRPNDEDSFIPKTILNYQKSKCTEV